MRERVYREQMQWKGKGAESGEVEIAYGDSPHTLSHSPLFSISPSTHCFSLLLFCIILAVHRTLIAVVVLKP